VGYCAARSHRVARLVNRVLAAWELALLNTQRVAHLATVSAAGEPAVVPVVFAFDGERISTPLDGKPKQVDVLQLRRVRDIAANPRVALVVDHYDEDWMHLAWVQLRGTATLVQSGHGYERSIILLAERYEQYATVPLVGRPLLVITPSFVRSWRAADNDVHS
jgi:PPOX class probable F420-dependent enzyme